MGMSHDQKLSRRIVLASFGAGIGAGLGGTGLVGALVSPAQAASGLVVIVHPSNNEVPSPSDLAAIFTTRRQTWKNGDRIVPFNFPARDAVRIHFDQAALGMDPDSVARYWIDRRIRGGNPPPKQVGSGALIVRLVGKMQGGIGYVPKELVTSDVRVIGSV